MGHENIFKKGLYNNLIWILFVSIFILISGEMLSYNILPVFDLENPFWSTFMQYFSFIGIWLTVVIAIKAFKKNHFIWDKLTLKSQGNNLKNLCIGLLVGCLLNSFCALLALMNGDITLEFSQFNVVSFLGLFFAVFVQSSAEEVLCRGFMYQRLMRSTHNAWFTILMNSLFFAVLHLMNDGITFLAFYDLLITGIFFSMMVYYYDSLWMAMGAHATWNFTQSILLGLPNSGSSFPYSIFKLADGPVKDSFAYDVQFGLEGTILASLVMTSCCVLLYLWHLKEQSGKVYL